MPFNYSLTFLAALFLSSRLMTSQATTPVSPPTRAASSNKQDPEVELAVKTALQQKAAGDQEGALTTLQTALEHAPRNQTLLKDLAIQALGLRRLKLADLYARRAHTLDSADLDTLYALARIEAEEDLFAASEKDFQTYLAARPNDASAHYGLAHLLQRNQEVDGAALEFRRSIALQPLQTESYYQLGQMALDAHREDEAESFFKQTLARDPEHGGSLTGLGILAYRGHKLDQARTFLKHAVLSSPDYQPAHYYLGLVLNRLGEKEEAAQELAVAKSLAELQQGKSSPQP